MTDKKKVVCCEDCGDTDHQSLGDTVILVSQMGKHPIKAKKELCRNCGNIRVVRA